MPTRMIKRRSLVCLACLAGLLIPQGVSAQTGGPPLEPIPATGPAPTSQPAVNGSSNALAPTNSLEPVVIVTTGETDVEIVERLSKAIELEKRILRVDGFDPEIIDVQALAPNRIRVQALLQGVTNLVLTDEDGVTWQLNIFVQGDARHLQAILDNRFPDSTIEAFKVQDAVALYGWVSAPGDITQIAELAEQFYPRVLNHMKVGGVQQVKMKVKIIEVQRSKLRRMGFDFFTSGESGFLSNNPANLFSAETSGSAVQLLGDALRGTTAFGLITDNSAFFGFLDALREEELLKILAEPVLVTTNGRPATIHSGGEFPILVPQAFGTLSIEYRDFGVRMEAVPIILGDGRVRLEVMPEVTEIDAANSVTLAGNNVPAVTTRQVNTQVEMRFGQTLMLAGLISSRQTASTAKIPFFGEVPWVGALFRRTQYEDVETELVVLVTPELVSPLDPAQVPPGGPGRMTTFPSDRELFFDGYIEVPRYGDECHGHGGTFGRGGSCTTCGPNAVRGGNRVFTMPITEQTVPMPDPGVLLGPLGSNQNQANPRAAATRGAAIQPQRNRAGQPGLARPSGRQSPNVRQVGWQTQVVNGTNPANVSTGRPGPTQSAVSSQRTALPARSSNTSQSRTPVSGRTGRPGLIAPP